jgi:hypothetical protein
MCPMKPLNSNIALLAGLFLTFLAADGVAAETPKPPAVPAHFELEVHPAVVSPGSQTQVLLQLSPVDGVKINRYPRVRLNVPETSGLVGAIEGSVGNDKAPPPGEMDANYFKKVDPVRITLAIDANAAVGMHEIPAKLTYFYCVKASGFCAPKTVSVEIPLRVE